MKKFLAFVVTAITVTTLAMISSCQKESTVNPSSTVSSSDEKNSLSQVFQPNALPYGKSYMSWMVAWWKWDLSFDCNHFPTFDTTGSLENQNHSGPVFFLAGSRHDYTLAVTIPSGASIFLPISTVEDDYPCGDQQLDSLVSVTTSFVNTITDLTLTIDGHAVNHLTSYKFISPVFTTAANADLVNCFDDCITGGPQQWSVGGYFVMLRPLSPGSHTIVRHATAEGGAITYDTTYDITQL